MIFLKLKIRLSLNLKVCISDGFKGSMVVVWVKMEYLK